MALAQGEMGTERLRSSANSGCQGERGAWDLGMDGLTEIAFLGFFLLQKGMQGIYPHPKYRDMGLSCPGSLPGTYFCSPWEPPPHPTAPLHYQLLFQVCLTS